MSDNKLDCPECDGNGWTYSGRCRPCYGKGWMTDREWEAFDEREIADEQPWQLNEPVLVPAGDPWAGLARDEPEF